MTVSFAQEFLDDVIDEIKPLLVLHWAEIAVRQERIKLNPDWPKYEALEAQGALRIFTARELGQLVGYFVTIVGPGLHYKDHLFAENDVIFLKSSHRKGLTGVKLMKFAEACLRQDGVSVLQINTKTHQAFDPILKRLGFECFERNYSKWISD